MSLTKGTEHENQNWSESRLWQGHANTHVRKEVTMAKEKKTPATLLRDSGRSLKVKSGVKAGIHKFVEYRRS
jgi:hypothetical protein